MLEQLKNPSQDDITATIKTSMGDIKVKFFPQYAPKAVENFTTHAKNRYYDGIIFHRVINDFMIQGGDPLGNGTGGESIWGDSFEDEFTPALHNLRGALCMANAGPNTNGSQFFIVQAKLVSNDLLEQMREIDEKFFPNEFVDAYEQMGGTPWLDFKHTVFGQVYEGMDVVDKIAAAEADPFTNKPFNDITIEEIILD